MSEFPPLPSTPGRFSPSALMTSPVMTELVTTNPLATPGTTLIWKPWVTGLHGVWHAPGVWVTGETYRLPRMLTRRRVAVCDVYHSIPPAGTLAWIGLIVRLDIWLSRIANDPLLMLRDPLITTSHGPLPRPATV